MVNMIVRKQTSQEVDSIIIGGYRGRGARTQWRGCQRITTPRGSQPIELSTNIFRALRLICDQDIFNFPHCMVVLTRIPSTISKKRLLLKEIKKAKTELVEHRDNLDIKKSCLKTKTSIKMCSISEFG